MGMNGLDVAGLRPFDLVIPFTIQKGEITGKIHTSAAVCSDDFCVVEFQRIVIDPNPNSPHDVRSIFFFFTLLAPKVCDEPSLKGGTTCTSLQIKVVLVKKRFR